MVLVVCTVLYVYSKRIKDKLIYILIGAVVFDLGGVALRYTSADHFISKREFQNFIPLTEADKGIQSDSGYYRVFNLNEGLNGARSDGVHHRRKRHSDPREEVSIDGCSGVHTSAGFACHRRRYAPKTAHAFGHDRALL